MHHNTRFLLLSYRRISYTKVYDVKFVFGANLSTSHAYHFLNDYCRSIKKKLSGIVTSCRKWCRAIHNILLCIAWSKFYFLILNSKKFYKSHFSNISIPTKKKMKNNIKLVHLK